MTDRSARLRPYVPGYLVDWLREAPAVRHRCVEGTLVFVDVSGFTRLTERLAARGKVGAEELTGLLDGTFGLLLGVAYAHGAWLVKWGGDAVLLLFQGDGHAERGCTAAIGMRRALADAGPLRTSHGAVRLRISTGVHSGRFDAFLVGSSHRELVLAGPGATTTAALEAAADPGQVAVSPATAALLPPRLVRRRDDGVLLLARSPGAAPSPPVRAEPEVSTDLRQCLARPVVEHLLSGDGVEDEAEHRRVCVAFVEFTGVDALLGAQGPGATAAAVDALVRTCQDAATRAGVTFWESDIGRDGGKIMLVAGAPGSTGADEDAILAVARDVAGAGGPLSIRVGVNGGRVFFGQFGPHYRRTMSVKGDAVNLAARLMARAGPSEVLASEEVLHAARTAYDVVPLPPFLVKGRAQPVSAATVGAPSARRDVTGDVAPLVGRVAELGVLDRAWQVARTGRLRSLELVGEAGIGKSRLLREFTVSTGAPVVELRCDPSTATHAHLPLRRAVRPLLGVAPDAAPGEVGQALLAVLARRAPELLPWSPLLATVLDASVPPTPEATALDERFSVQRQEEATVDLLVRLLPGPTLLAVDDAHLLDPSSAALLDRLPSRAARSPWLLVRSGRAPEGDEAEPLAAVDDRLVLGPLDAVSLGVLAQVLTDDAPLAPHETAALLQRAGGNPLFLAALVHAAAQGLRLDELPGSVEAVLAAAVDRLRPADRALLRAAAVVGREVDLDVLRGLALRTGSALDDGALDRLRPFLETHGSRRLRFRQALLHEVAYEGLPYRRRTVLHGHVGDVLLERVARGAQVDDAVLALHFLRSQRYEQAWPHARSAAAAAHAARAHAEAAQLDERAVEAAEGARLPAHEVAEAYESLGDARSRLGQFDRAAAAYSAARRRLRARPTDAARLHLRSAQCAERSGRYREALRLLSTGQRLLSTPQEPELRRLSAELSVARATVRHWQGRHRDAVRECARAVTIGEQVGALDVVAEALVWLDVSELMLGRGDGTPAARALMILRERGDRPWLLARCLNEVGIRAYYAGDWDGASRSYRACRESFTEAGDAWAAAQASANEAEVLLDQGRWAEAEPLLREALRAGRSSHAAGFVAFVLALQGRLRARTGRGAEGLTDLRSASAAYAAIGERAEVLDTDARTAECLVLSGDPQGAVELVRSLQDCAGSDHLVGGVVPVLHRVQGLALHALGRPREARTSLELALAAAQAAGARHECAYALHALVRLHESTGLAVPDDTADRLAGLRAELGIVRIAEPGAARPDQAQLPSPAPGAPSPTGR